MLHNFKYILFLLSIAVTNGFATGDQYNDILSACKPPTNIKITEAGIDFTTINWKNDSNGVAWKIKWRRANDDYNDTNVSSLINKKEYRISGLEPSTKYYFKIQTLCSDDSESKWSFEYSFITHLQNPSTCNMHLKLQDAVSNNNKTIPGKTYFFIKNEEFPEGKLGENVFIQNIKLIIDHSWTNDLTIKLWSPNGKSTTLASSHKAKDESSGYGNSTLIDCLEPIIFSDEACEKLSKQTSQLIGEFKPDEEIYSLYDSISPIGDWKLEIIDKSIANSGYLEFFEIDFEPLLCPLPQKVSIIPQNENAILINWQQNEAVDSMVFNLVTNGKSNIIKSEDTGFKIVSGLNNNDTIFISLQSKCENNISTFTCLDSVSFLCGTAQLREGFDSFENCKSSCEDCLNNSIWYNNSEQNWLVNSGETTTKNTGPQDDVYGNGKYIYFESSNSDCDNQGLAILQSECIYVEPAFDGCSMQFSYYMYGVDVGALSFEVSIDNGSTWDTLFFRHEESINKWIKQEIPLDKYEQNTCQFRFVARSLNNGSYGDIAIDDIIFFNSVIADEDSYLYFPDRDGDGYGKDTTGVFFCNLTGDNYVSNSDDCDDTNASINPGAEEIRCNFIDENCNGMDDDSEIESPFSIEVDSIFPESCNGSRDGKVSLKILGGYPPFSFQWSNGSIDSILTNVQAGKYWCKITDQSGCGLVSDTFDIGFNDIFNFEVIDKTQPTCSGKNDGQINIDLSGGVSPYKYTWSNGDTTQNISGINAGNYNITIIDSIGCKYISTNIELKATTTFDIGLLEKVNPSCYGLKNGKISLRVMGGTPPYSIDWDKTNKDSTDISNLESGEYFCTITDSDLCYQEYGPILLKQPDSLSILISSIDHVTCFGENNGLIEIDTKGGTSPYTFEWKQGDKTISRHDDIYNLETGKYTIIASDNNGCTKTLEDIEITTIDSLNIKLDSLKNVNCSGTNDGLLSVNAQGGYGDYYYYWSNGNNISNTIDSLNTGIYSITVEDDLACKQVLTNLEISNLNIPLKVNLSSLENIKCFGDSSGIISVTADSKNAPFDFNWSAGSKIIKNDKSDTLIYLPVGNYTVTVTDNLGCVGKSKTVMLTQPEKLVINEINTENILCFGDKTGEINVSSSGGVLPYSILWSNGSNEFNVKKLFAGIYDAEITDSNNCKISTGDIKINQPNEIKVTIESYPAHKDKADGYAIILPSGGVTPYTFLWDDKTNFQTGNKAVNLKSGWYTVTLTDYNECLKEIKVFIAETTSSISTISNSDIKIFPNPTSKGLFITFMKDEKFKYNIELMDLAGMKISVAYKYITANKVWLPLQDYSNGIYILHILNNKSHYFERVLVLH